MYNKILKEILTQRNSKKAQLLSRFFKTSKGEYGEGDKFLGITVPVSRSIAKKYGDIKLKYAQKLLENKYHEVRLVALLILVHKYKTSSDQDLEAKKEIVDFYLKSSKYINNWDLVDLSAGYILGDYLLNKDRKILLKLAKSKSIWERRISIVSTFAFIYEGESKWTFKITDTLMGDGHDLIHKACGWMLREVGKRVSERDLTTYLDSRIQHMPRTMLRYAIERLEEDKRLYYLHK